ncbi:MAG: DinB family protein [Planctomycetota bacterium]|nr:DinB family protein [Planctomycetota bacterium]
MHVSWMIDRLQQFPAALTAMVGTLDPLDAGWRPTPRDWSILEIVCHLIDEDLDDFGTRLRLVQEWPTSGWPRIDPEAAAIDRDYCSRWFLGVLDEFLMMRRAKVGWLPTIAEADVETRAQRPRPNQPEHEAMSAGDLLASRCAHDALHPRRIVRRLHRLTDHHAGSRGVGCAGGG